jgi:hypothetical protein
VIPSLKAGVIDDYRIVGGIGWTAECVWIESGLKPGNQEGIVIPSLKAGVIDYFEKLSA